MPSGSSGSSISSGGLKRPYDALDAADESQDLFKIMRIESDVDPKRDMEPPPMKNHRSPNENENIGLGRDLERIQFSANYLKQHHAIKQHVSLDFPKVKDPQRRDDTQLTEFDAKIDKLGKKD